MKKILAGILALALITSTIFVSAEKGEITLQTDSSLILYDGGEPTIDDYIVWIGGSIQNINEYKSGDPTENYYDFYSSMNITQETTSLAPWLNSLEKKMIQSGRKADDEIISLIVGVKYAIAGVEGSGTDKVAAAVSSLETNLNISYEKAGNSVYTDTLKGFSDLEQHAWAKDGIEDMSVGSYKGLFGGTTAPDENGFALFSPDQQMTRAEFITVVTRTLFAQELADMPVVTDGMWYKNNYWVAVRHGIISKADYALSEEVLNAPIPRQEMALILIHACFAMGESTSSSSRADKIADFDTIDEAYQGAVLKTYAKGLLTGVDDKGSFAPHQTLTRAEAATVLYRLVNPLKRLSGGLVEFVELPNGFSGIKWSPFVPR